MEWSYLCQCGTVSHEKAAKYFGEEATATSILSSDYPVVAKKLGSKVCISKKAAWDSVCDKYMQEGLTAKFTQNHEVPKS